MTQKQRWKHFIIYNCTVENNIIFYDCEPLDIIGSNILIINAERDDDYDMYVAADSFVLLLDIENYGFKCRENISSAPPYFVIDKKYVEYSEYIKLYNNPTAMALKLIYG